ncbi:MAG: MmgE/PrpD family protein [Actinobacteria bacterium]|nr:MmgE/PrpD family protein [Actinomycetota bacterium]MBI3688533.1 MmgE/PrpD family protein [Actinomycetota bacterium]
MTLSERLSAWASGLVLADVPERVVGAARTQLLSQLGSIRAGSGHPLGMRVTGAFGPPLQADPKRSAYVLAALSIGLDFDDTAYAGHLSHSTVNVPLAYARPLTLTGADLLTAVIAANECAGRVTAAATIGPFRGQTATHAHLTGAVAARLRAEAAPAPVWVSALGLALALPMWPIGRGFYGSDAKLLAAATPVLAGLDACDAGRHGLVGAPDILEHPDGFLARYAEVPLPDAVVAGLGERWHTETFSFKVYPGSAYTSAAVDCAVDLHQQLGRVDPADVAEIEVAASLFTTLLERGTTELVDGAGSTVPALNFSVGYNVATALLTGWLGPADLAEPRVGDPARWSLAGKVRVVHDPALSEQALLATAPIGEALRQAGPRAREWVGARAGGALVERLAALGPPADTFETATKRLGARVTVRFADGRETTVARAEARGAVGWRGPAERHALVRQKFLATGGDPDVADAVERLETLSGAELAGLLDVAVGTTAGGTVTGGTVTGGTVTGG